MTFNFVEKLCTFLSCRPAETQKCCKLLFRVCDYNRKCLNNGTGQRSVFSWCSLSRARCISINSRIDLCALSPYVYPIDIRIPLSAVFQIGAGRLRSSFTEKYFVETLSPLCAFYQDSPRNYSTSSSQIWNSAVIATYIPLANFRTNLYCMYVRRYVATRSPIALQFSEWLSRNCPCRHFMIMDTVFTIHRIRNIVRPDAHFKSTVNNL